MTFSSFLFFLFLQCGVFFYYKAHMLFLFQLYQFFFSVSYYCFSHLMRQFLIYRFVLISVWCVNYFSRTYRRERNRVEENIILSPNLFFLFANNSIVLRFFIVFYFYTKFSVYQCFSFLNSYSYSFNNQSYIFNLKLIFTFFCCLALPVMMLFIF